MKYVVQKNLLISVRNYDFIIESVLPIVVACMLGLKCNITNFNNI